MTTTRKSIIASLVNTWSVDQLTGIRSHRQSKKREKGNAQLTIASSRIGRLAHRELRYYFTAIRND